MRAMVAPFVAAVCLFSIPLWAITPDYPIERELGRYAPGFTPLPTRNFAVADFDGDGVDDVAFAGVGFGDTLVQVYGHHDGSYASKQLLVVPDSGVAQILAHTVGGTPHLYVFTSQGKAWEYAGWPLQEVRAFDLNNGSLFWSLGNVVIGDADADGRDELIFYSGGGLGSGVVDYDLETLTLRWTKPNAAGDVLLAQLDADPALEIVVTGRPGKVFDGATQVDEWSYKDGFGSVLAPYHAGSAPQFVAAGDNGFVVFQGQPYSPLWDSNSNDYFRFNQVATADLNGDGNDEVVISDWTDIFVYDGSTHQQVLRFPHGGYETSAMGLVDLDGDGVREIAFAPDRFSTDMFDLFDAQNGSMKWRQSIGVSGPYSAPSAYRSSSGDVRFLFGGEQTLGVSAWVQLDAWTGSPLWQHDLGDLPRLVAGSASIADLAGAGSALVLAGQGAQFPMIVAIDEPRHQTRWRIDGDVGHPLEGRSIIALNVLSEPSGAADTGLACMESSQGARVFAFDLATGSAIWESIGMNDQCVGVMGGNFGNGAPVFAAVLSNSIRAYDATTHLLAWTLPGATDGATLLDGVAGRELAIFSGTHLVFHDGVTRQVIRQFNLGASISALQELGDIHTLVVAAGGRLLVVDGATGQLLTSSDYLGSSLATGNQLAVQDIGGGAWFVGATTGAAVFRYRILTTDTLFANGFDPEVSPRFSRRDAGLIKQCCVRLSQSIQ